MNFRYLLLVPFLWATPAFAASPSPDGTCNTGASATACPTVNGGSTFTGATVTTTGGAGGCLIAIIGLQNISTAAPTVSSISSTNTTGWAKRASVTDAHNDLEEWSGTYSGTLSAEALTITLSASVTANAGFQLMAVKGTHSGCSFDSHAATTSSTASMSSGVVSMTQTTSQADDLLISMSWNGNGVFGAYTSGTFNSVAGTIVGSGVQNGSGSGNDGNFGIFELGVSATVSAVTDTQTNNGSSTGTGLSITDALTADAAGGGSPPTRLLLGVGK